MKEITRIHIAKVAYDIELDAKKDIQAYISALERYADDAELLGDIEIRITELLAERGVTAGNVIAKDDVVAIRTQLGEPADFLLEDASGVVDETEEKGRKLYRDLDSAVLGGVLAGTARFFRIDPVWARLLFIVLLFVSFGAVIFAYLLLWLIVPPARTAAEKLRMNGQAVTLASIKSLGEQEEPSSQTARVVHQVLLTGLSIVMLLCAIGAIGFTLFMVTGLSLGAPEHLPFAVFQSGTPWWATLAVVLLALAGVLLAAFFSLLAYAVSSRRWTKRIGMAVTIVVVAGVIMAMSGIGAIAYGRWNDDPYMYGNAKSESAVLTKEFAANGSLTIKDEKVSVRVDYIVTSDTPHYELASAGKITPLIKVGDDGTTTLTIQRDEHSRRFYSEPHLTIYGPALTKLDAEAGEVRYTTSQRQKQLAATVQASSSIDISGSFDAVRVMTYGQSSVSLTNATIDALAIDMQGGHVEAGVVRSLTVNQPNACPATNKDDDNSVELVGVSSGRLTINGDERASLTTETACGVVQVGEDSTKND